MLRRSRILRPQSRGSGPKPSIGALTLMDCPIVTKTVTTTGTAAVLDEIKVSEFRAVQWLVAKNDGNKGFWEVMAIHNAITPGAGNWATQVNSSISTPVNIGSVATSTVEVVLSDTGPGTGLTQTVQLKVNAPSTFGESTRWMVVRIPVSLPETING